ncbi:MAG: protein kinase [Myxococcales bacterium]|nr:protein kinase [Myxococcales bacterium]
MSRIGSIELGCFRLQEIIGQGSYGVTYRAEQLGFDRDAVVKIAHAELLDSRDGELVRRRFEDELRAATRVQHPNLVTLYTAGQTNDGLPAIAMELVSGDLLEDLLIAYPGGLPLELIGPAFTQLASALAALHAADVVHRDLSPRNVMLDTTARPPRLKVLDFGVARLRGRPRHTIGAVGTPRYMAPEQLVGHALPASDMFSLGAVLWWALTGEEFRRDTLSIEDLYLTNLDGRSDTDPRTVVPELPEKVSALTERLLAHHERERPSAQEFLSLWPAALAELRQRRSRPRSGKPMVPPPPPVGPSVAVVAGQPLGKPPTYNSLPAVDSERPVSSPRQGPRALVVDANAITQHLIVGCLRRNGCQVQSTRDPRDATRSSPEAFDLVVLSNDISVADPVDIARYLQDYHPSQWVVMTGTGQLDDAAREAGVRDLLRVPTDFERLGELVDMLRGELALRDSVRPQTTSDAIDRTMLDGLYADDPTNLRETIEMFLGQVPESLVRIVEHHEVADSAAVQEECRSLSASARALGANHLARLAHAAAALVSDGDLDCIPGFATEMEREYGLVFRALMDVHASTLPGGPR